MIKTITAGTATMARFSIALGIAVFFHEARGLVRGRSVVLPDGQDVPPWPYAHLLFINFCKA